MPLIDLSAELIFFIASFVRQVDLLNLSLVCKHLRAVTEPELYREYSNLHSSHSIVPFIKRVIEDERLTRYVERIDLRSWDTLETFNPVFYEVHPRFRDEHNKAAEFNKYRPKEPLRDEYELYTAAAKAAGIITEIIPYPSKSLIIEKVAPMEAHELDPDMLWHDLIFDDEISFNSLPYDQRFCHTLRAGIEDPLVVLMVAMLPNVS